MAVHPTILIVAAASLAVAGCSIAIPIPSLMSGDDMVSSIPKRVVLSERLGRDDLRIAGTALDAALDAREPKPVAWHNPKTRAKGSFVTQAGEHPKAACQDFLAEIETVDAPREKVRGSACRTGGGSWRIKEVSAQDAGEG